MSIEKNYGMVNHKPIGKSKAPIALGQLTNKDFCCIIGIVLSNLEIRQKMNVECRKENKAIDAIPQKRKYPIPLQNLNMYPGRELNPYSRCGEQDFKSCASTNSATQV
jgi:hypothetical protein